MTGTDIAELKRDLIDRAKRDARFVASMRVLYARWQDNDSFTPMDFMRAFQREHIECYGQPCEPEVKS